MLTQGRAPQHGRTPLIIAVRFGRNVAAQVLLEAGANTEARNEVRARRGGAGGGEREKWDGVSCFMPRARGAGNCLPI